ncbi:MAG: hypothetical protein KC535_00460 [Nanoarchaeota archaeon]|nr:hypothetical protein [Nanoarchaeota archaeon]
MATFLDVSLFGYFGSIFIFLFVFAIVWGILTWAKIFKGVPGEKGIYGLVALSIGLIVMISSDTSTLIATMAPWFAVLMIFVFLVFLIFRMFSGDDHSQLSSAIKSPGVYWTLIVLSVIILLASLSSTFGQRLLDDGQGTTTSVNIDSRNEVTNPQEITDGTTSTTTTTTDAVSGSTATNSFSDNVLSTITHPKVLGLIMMMFISFFAILLIARSQDPNV